MARWRRNATLGAVGALVAFGVGGGLAGGLTWLERARFLFISIVYGESMALTAPFVFGRFFRRFGKKNRIAWFAARLVALPVMCLIGGGLTMMIVVPLRLLRPAFIRPMMFPYLYSAAGPGIVGAVFIAVIAFELFRDQLESTTLALRTKERDEAEARRIAIESQLTSLEARVQPHFLFNTLNSIAALIPSDPRGAERMTGQLAALMRAALNADPTALVPLSEEIGIVQAYLQIERVRFGERLRYTVDLPPELREVCVPRLAVQTLVENAVKYAVAPRLEGATVAIRAARMGHVMRVSVEDDGPGFDASALSAGHGLALLRARLAMTLPERAQLTVDSRDGRILVAVEVTDAALEETLQEAH